MIVVDMVIVVAVVIIRMGWLRIFSDGVRVVITVINGGGGSDGNCYSDDDYSWRVAGVREESKCDGEWNVDGGGSTGVAVIDASAV